MWCTGKLTTPSPNKDKQEMDLKSDTRLQFSTEMRARKEDDEAYVIYNADDDVFFMVNQTCYDFIMELKKQGSFSFGQLCLKNNLTTGDTNINDIVSFLIKKKIVKII